MNGSISNRIAAWFKSPYDDHMSVGGWFAFLGMIAVLTWLWSRVLRTMMAAKQ